MSELWKMNQGKCQLGGWLGLELVPKMAEHGFQVAGFGRAMEP